MSIRPGVGYAPRFGFDPAVVNATLLIIALTPSLNALLAKVLQRWFPARGYTGCGYFWDDRALRRNRVIDQCCSVILIYCLLAASAVVLVALKRHGPLHWMVATVPLATAWLAAACFARVAARLANGWHGHAQFVAYCEMESGYRTKALAPLGWLFWGLGVLGAYLDHTALYLAMLDIVDYLGVVLASLRSL
ncbi:hypothetical protein GCM10007860_34360 [Chitiniphilus shinanonensis]|uniref:Uncharacterized protein n=1 Tax=Chitiniphilus shinanonensis TaxID=553088 RepID=A0ABQ6BYP4_9NEIS|nr:hypothetical protein [Chitiniphilus shinanonensis]GLS06260.1 hypothetical protein GCM10007860_34360 [Chitiniphilus shinanonensis]